MKNLFIDTRPLDEAARKKYGLTEKEMMEHAAEALEKKVLDVLKKRSRINRYASSTNKENFDTILILCGTGNNGGDGYALAARLRENAGGVRINPVVYRTDMPKSDMCRFQADRAKKDKTVFYQSSDGRIPGEIGAPAVIVDCVFGAGFHGLLDEKTAHLMQNVNEVYCVRIACDIPTGLACDGTADPSSFKADYTVTMGALKESLFSDKAKDLCGEITCAELGVHSSQFEDSAVHTLDTDTCCEPDACLLEETDIILPHRTEKIVNKGSFGHAVIVRGDKGGAAVIAGSAALRYGAGLVTIVSNNRITAAESELCLPEISDTKGTSLAFPELMLSDQMPANTTAVALGMGLGRTDGTAKPYYDWLTDHPQIPCVLDADVFYDKNIINFIKQRSKDYCAADQNKKTDCGIVLTPHPKEFQSLLSLAGLGEYTVADCAGRRIELVKKFCREFPGVVILVKGANPVIGFCAKTTVIIKEKEDVANVLLFINPLGMPCLAKAGSGDVLSGLICSLLAQYTSKNPAVKTMQMMPLLAATLQGSLAHALASSLVECDYAMTPFTLIQCTTELADYFGQETHIIQQRKRKMKIKKNEKSSQPKAGMSFAERIKSFFKGFNDVSSHAGGCGYIAPHTLGKSPVNPEDCKSPCDEH